MKIESLNQKVQVQSVMAARVDQRAASNADTGVKSSRDKVEISGFSSVNPLLKAQQPVRTEKVQELKALIANGGYQVPGRAVAEAMLSKVAMA